MKQCNVVILAGGFGERLWPVSCKDFPKQFMALDGGLSFLQQSLKRAFLLQECKNILIITRQDILKTAKKQCEDFASSFDKENKKNLEKKLLVIAEPSQKHTTPPIMFAARYFELKNEEKVPLLVLTSDHCIKTQEQFEKDVLIALDEAEKGNFVCFAIPPTEPSTGFGYMEVEEGEGSSFKITNFKEKPNAERAMRYLDSGNYWWNSGMFCVTPLSFIEEIKIHTTDVFDVFPLIKKDEDSMAYMEKAYNKTIAISIDHAVAEKTKKAMAVRASFEWHDIGTWDSFSEQFEQDLDSNSFTGNVAQTNTKNCFVYTDTPVVLTGVEDLIVTVKEGKILIAQKGCSQDIKDTVSKLEIKD